MTTVDKEIVRRKLTVLIENLKVLGPIKAMTLKQYSNDVYKRKATERLLQQLIKATIDINTHIIVQIDNSVVGNYYESFLRMGDINVIPVKTRQRACPISRFTNRASPRI